MKRVLLVATGDTIAYRPGSSAVASGADLLATVTPAARVVVEDVLAEPSWDTSPATMAGLARRVRAALLDDEFDGVVVTHGLDTVEDTAFLTDLLAGPAAARGGIVFTGAVRCLDDPASDGPRNLAAALTAAADPVLRGVGAVVCIDQALHAARWARLTDCTQPAAFTSAPHPVLGHIVDGKVELAATPPARPPQLRGELESDVAVIRTYPGMTSTLVTAAVDAGARGVVLEGTGAGNVPGELFTTISELTEWGIPVVIASRARTPEELPPASGLAFTLGAISAGGLTATHARCALMVALGSGGIEAARAWFSTL